MKRYVLFDLDGTLTDSRPGIVNSIVYCLNYFGIAVPDTEALRPWLGPPLHSSLQQYCGLSKEQALLGVAKFREYFNAKGAYENSVYPGVREMLETLNGNGFTILLATSKPESAARRIMAHFDMDRYFAYIGGASDDDSRTAKADVIRYVLGVAGVDGGSIADGAAAAAGGQAASGAAAAVGGQAASGAAAAVGGQAAGGRLAAVMVGDSRHDVIGAKANGLKCIGVSYGYGLESELQTAGADWIVKDTEGICQILLDKF